MLTCGQWVCPGIERGHNVENMWPWMLPNATWQQPTCYNPGRWETGAGQVISSSPVLSFLFFVPHPGGFHWAKLPQAAWTSPSSWAAEKLAYSLVGADFCLSMLEEKEESSWDLFLLSASSPASLERADLPTGVNAGQKRRDGLYKHQQKTPELRLELQCHHFWTSFYPILALQWIKNQILNQGKRRGRLACSQSSAVWHLSLPYPHHTPRIRPYPASSFSSEGRTFPDDGQGFALCQWLFQMATVKFFFVSPIQACPSCPHLDSVHSCSYWTWVSTWYQKV